MEGKTRVYPEYTSGSYHQPVTQCREDDDYWIFWSEKRFTSYFVDDIFIPCGTEGDEWDE